MIITKKQKIVKPKNAFCFHFFINSFLVVKNPGNKYKINTTNDAENAIKKSIVGISGTSKPTIDEFSYPVKNLYVTAA